MKLSENFFGELSENFRKTDEPQFCENQTKTLPLKLEKFTEIFGEFSENYRQTVDDFYLNKYFTILVPHFS